MSKNNNLKKAIEDSIGVPLSEIQRKATEEDIFLVKFSKFISKLEELHDRDIGALADYNIDNTAWNTPFYDTIHLLIEMLFPDNDLRKLVYFYVYERIDIDGDILPVEVNGVSYILDSPYKLFNLISMLTR